MGIYINTYAEAVSFIEKSGHRPRVFAKVKTKFGDSYLIDYDRNSVPSNLRVREDYLPRVSADGRVAPPPTPWWMFWKSAAPEQMPKQRDANTNTADDDLIQAVMGEDIAATERALRSGGNPNTVNEGGNSALQLAARYGCVEIVQALISAGAHVNATNSAGDTPLRFAATGLRRAKDEKDEEYSRRFRQVVELLQASGAN